MHTIKVFLIKIKLITKRIILIYIRLKLVHNKSHKLYPLNKGYLKFKI